MSGDLARHPELERRLAKLLDRGSRIGSAVVAVGLGLALAGQPGEPVVFAGIAIFILLPVLRLLVMLVAFLRERDYLFGAIATLVLTIIALGAALGMHIAGRPPG